MPKKTAIAAESSVTTKKTWTKRSFHLELNTVTTLKNKSVKYERKMKEVTNRKEF